MTNQMEVYKCNICGNIVEVLHTGAGQLVCCGQPMELFAEKIEEEGNEKHKPVLEQTTTGMKVKIGSVPHPMEDEHYIEWIEVIADNRVHRKFLSPADKPEADFNVKADKIESRAYCNVHGMWKA